MIPGDVIALAVGRIETDKGWQDVRLVVTGSCSPEHCFSRGHLEWFSASIPDRGAAVVATTSIEELESVLVVNSVRWMVASASERGHFELRAANTYTEEEGTIRVFPMVGQQYEAITSP